MIVLDRAADRPPDVDHGKPVLKPPPEANEPLPEQEPEPAPEAAEAAKVLTQEPDLNEPLDLTNEGFISGSGTRFAGGITAADGTATKAVRNRRARAGGVPGGRGTEPKPAVGPVGKDLSSPAAPIVGGGWDCPFPPESDVEQVNFARVTLVVTVGTDGRAKSASVLSDPGFGFGRAARACALGKRYNVARDKLGRPVAQTTRPFIIKFSR